MAAVASEELDGGVDAGNKITFEAEAKFRDNTCEVRVSNREWIELGGGEDPGALRFSTFDRLRSLTFGGHGPGRRWRGLVMAHSIRYTATSSENNGRSRHDPSNQMARIFAPYVFGME